MVMAARIATQSRRAENSEKSGLVTFNVGGKHFQVLAQTILARPQTLLANLLTDLGTDQAEPIFIDANPDRFGAILDWYRYDEMNVPPSISIPALVRDARFFLLPDHVMVNSISTSIAPHLPTQARTAQDMHGALLEGVLARWLGFDAFLSDILNQVRTYFSAVAERSDVRSLLPGTRLQIPSHVPEGALAVFAIDPQRHSEHLCNMTRVQVLILKLHELGFLCWLTSDEIIVALDTHAPSGNRHDHRILPVEVMNVGAGGNLASRWCREHHHTQGSWP